MSETRESDIMTLIYNKINDMIGAGNQLFSMQFPAQPLNPDLYRYDTKDRNSVLTKPFTIAEAEFRLADQLFDVSPITAGSNGEKLSIVYNTAINNYIPKLDYLAPFIRDRAGLGHWLLENTNEKDEKGNILTRIDLCKKLYQEYLEAKNAWNEEKNKKFDELKQKDGGMDDYAKWQSSYGMVKTEELNNLYNDVVISGHLHEVLTILGYLNASSIAEELEIGKQKMRNSARLSLDESLTVYPVQFSPNNWFKALSPNLNPSDLTMAKESIRDIYFDKKKELMRAKGDLQKAELMSTTQQDVLDAQKAVEKSKVEVSNAEKDLISNFGDGIVGIAKIYFNTFGPGAAVNTVKALGLGADPSKIDLLKQAVDGIGKTQKVQDDLTTAMGNLSSVMAKKAEVESKDWRLNKEAIKQRVNELEVDVTYYGDLLSEVTKAHASQNRIETTRKSFTDKTLVYEIGISDSITGGKLSVKVASKTPPSTQPKLVHIDIPPLTNEGKIDFSQLAINIQAQIVIPFPNSTVKEIDDVNSPGYYLLKIIYTDDKEPEFSIDEQELLPAVEVKEPDTLTDEVSVEDAEIQGMFSDILLKISDSSDISSATSSSQASHSNWGVSVWFASASGLSSQSSGSSSQRSEFFNQEIEIGFRVAKVSFDRGGWFNPQIFKMGHAFTRLADILVSPGLTVADVKGKDPTELSSKFKYDNNHAYILPAFPVAMAIVKDVTIKVKKSTMTSFAAKSVVESASASSGGFLCFSASRSSSSKNSSESAMHGAHGEYYYIKIPGPQVIGYFLQMVPEDTTEMYKPAIDIDGKNSIIEAFKLYNTAPELLKASDDILKDQTV
jgi:hypothetical protein